MSCLLCLFFFFQAEDGIRDVAVTGVQTCALPIYPQTDPVPAGDTARAGFAVSCASVRIIGLGQIQDAWTPPSWWDEFNFDVRSDLTGKLVYNEHWRSEEHTSELQSRLHLVCRLLLEKKKH